MYVCIVSFYDCQMYIQVANSGADASAVEYRESKYHVLQERRVLRVVIQVIHVDDGVDIRGPKCCMVVTNNGKEAIDFFVKFSVKDDYGPNFFCPVQQLYEKIPVGQ